jgi:hypothetical protein
MSFYGSRRNRSLDNDLQWERLMLKAVRTPPPPRSQSVQEIKLLQLGSDFAHLRKANPVNNLLPSSLKWLKSVPEQARPVALATRYARIVNVLAQHWNDPSACSAYFDDLLIDRRGNRQGFPTAVASDIRVLREYFLHSKPQGQLL